MSDKIVLIVYGLLLIIGGYFGSKKGSKVSLVMGAGCGILVFFGVWMMTFNPRGAWIFLTCLNALLALVFLLRVIKTRAFMPAGMLLLITLSVLIFCLTK